MMTTSFDDLPQETTVDIFLRLPVKDLIRSTSVNKTWHSLINNPSFISSQIRNAISSCDDNAVLIIPPVTSHKNYCSLVSADTSELIEKFHIPFVTKSRTLKLIAEVHGLLLLSDLHVHYDSIELYLWNPYVKRHRLLVSGCLKKLVDDPYRSVSVVGMGFRKASDDYRVVRIVYVGDHERMLFGDIAPKVEIYSLRENTWRKLKNPGVPRLVNDHGTYFDGCYYWLGRNEPQTEKASGCYGNRLKIMYFDFQNELFGELKVPDNVPRTLGKGSPHKLMQFENSLALCVLEAPLLDKVDIRLRVPSCIWLMRQENGVVNWNLRFRSLLKHFGYPLGITKNATLIIESLCLNNLDVRSIVSCNLNSMIHKDHGFGNSRGPEALQSFLDVSTVDTSFPKSLIMYEGGKLLLKSAK